MRPIRWIALLLASVLVHVVAFNWADGRLGMPAWHTQEQQVVMTELHPAPVPIPPAPSPVAAAPKPKPKVRPRKRAAPPPPVPPIADAVPSMAPRVDAQDANAETAAGPADADNRDAAQSSPADAPESKPQEPTATSYKINPPPSAELNFDVEALVKGQSWHGSGTYQWETTGDNYTATVEVGMTVFVRITGLNTKSEGKITEVGLAPVLYSEKTIRRPLVNTHFQHDNHKISFSASEAVYPYNGGEQDRASILWQLASMGRADASHFAPGAVFDIVVASTRDAENWHFNVIGLEEVDTTAYGKVNAWHVKRTPNPGSYDRALEIWFAPEHEWYPVKVRQTEAGGDYYDLALTKIAPVAAP